MRCARVPRVPMPTGLSLPDLTSYDPKRAEGSLFSALLRARRAFGGSRAILTDGDERTLTYDQIVKASFALGHALTRGTDQAEALGVLLPTGVGSVLTVFALSAYGRVPAMLNFTAGLQSLEAALKAAEITRVITAHRFIELGKFEELEAWLAARVKLIYLEDVRENLSLRDKAAAGLGMVLPRAVMVPPAPTDPALILFTSGTEGEPKGVALSHGNILSNVEQVRAHIPFYDSDIVFNPLPTFHSFGLTVGALMPLYLGVKSVLHPTPRQPHEIVRRIREHGATILLATDTFISQYARVASEGDLASLRLAVCGAERLRDETRHLVRQKYRAELLEGYGVTEASPVIAANQPGANRPGTVGRTVAELETRIDPVEGISNAGRLYVRGPNVMLGYLRADRPGTIEAPRDGWHDTGDVVAMDEDGFIAIRGRLKRFAKIGGETVSLTVVENCASALWPEHMHAAVAVPDGRKGEQIILVTTCADANRGEFVAWVQNHGVAELAVPRRVVQVAEIPVLGTGKTDYPSVTRLIAESSASGAVAP
jgi:acyl-[acyl-carrier-protein]-phospholipid O-acyltransferase / long-chain-fatty-acid--[acyl-carrier-protein] ligase